jgi:hypothetical protein
MEEKDKILKFRKKLTLANPKKKEKPIPTVVYIKDGRVCVEFDKTGISLGKKEAWKLALVLLMAAKAAYNIKD